MHKAEPLGVAVGVLAVHEAVVVLEVFVAGVVGRVDVDHVHAAFVGEGQGREGVEVVAFDEEVVAYLNLIPRGGPSQPLLLRGEGEIIWVKFVRCLAWGRGTFNRFNSSTLLQGTTIKPVGCWGEIECRLIAAGNTSFLRCSIVTLSVVEGLLSSFQRSQNPPLGYLGQHGQILAEEFFDVFGLVFPHEAVFLFGIDEVDEVALLIGGEGVEVFEGTDEVGFVHGWGCGRVMPGGM